jgi:hypothetical protein
MLNIYLGSDMGDSGNEQKCSRPSSARYSTLWSAMDMGGSVFKRGWCGGGGILMVYLCPRALSLR